MGANDFAENYGKDITAKWLLDLYYGCLHLDCGFVDGLQMEDIETQEDKDKLAIVKKIVEIMEDVPARRIKWLESQGLVLEDDFDVLEERYR